MSQVCVAGVGMIPLTKPGANEPYHAMAAAAGRLALGLGGACVVTLYQAG